MTLVLKAQWGRVLVIRTGDRKCAGEEVGGQSWMNNVTGFDAKDSKAARAPWEILEPKSHCKGSNFHLLQDMGSFPLVRSKKG